MRKKEYIIIDRKVASAFIHQAGHLELRFVIPEHADLKVKLNTGKERTIKELMEEAKERVESLSEYLRLAIEK